MINIFVSNGVSYIWSPEDWYDLRKNHRIMGAFDGAEGEGWTNPIHLNLPLRLSDVETQYLIRAGIGRTVEISELYDLMVPVLLEECEQLRADRLDKQIQEYKVKRRVTVESMVDKIIEGKIKAGRGVIPDRETVINEEMAKIKSAPFDMIQIDLMDPWARRSVSNFKHYDFPLPKSELDTLRARVFEDFHRRGHYYISDGIKFGGDFLAYPGDPINFHSEFIIMCEPRTSPIPQLHIESQRRLAQTVNKVLVIAGFENKDYSISSNVLYKKYDRRPSKKMREAEEFQSSTTPFLNSHFSANTDNSKKIRLDSTII